MSYGEWDYYSESRPRKIEGGIKAKSGRGAIGETWWSKRWVHVLETLGMGARLARGRSYARQGQVLSINVAPGQVKARVQGSLLKPYFIAIQLQPLSDEDWESVIGVMASQALFAAKLLAGEMPAKIEDAFSAADLSLFPTTEEDLLTKCSCPDWANPCKHIAAVYYILAEQFDEDPFLIFKLRGRSKEEIVEALRHKRAEALPSEAASAPVVANVQETVGDATLHPDSSLETFWIAGEALDNFVVNPGKPAVNKAVLKRLGDAPFSIGGQNLANLLAQAYDMVESAALSKTAEGER